MEQKRLEEALSKQKEEDEILAEAKVFRETDKLKSHHELEKEKMVRLKSSGLIFCQSVFVASLYGVCVCSVESKVKKLGEHFTKFP